MTGFGDLVAKVAQPIAAASDAILGTHIKGCGGCVQRQAALNRVFPFKPKPAQPVKPIDEAR